MAKRKNEKYKDGELETILSLVPTKDNIARLSALLERSEQAIRIVYRIAYQHGSFGKDAKAQEKKVLAAKKKVGIVLGRSKPRS
ncbi:hypothetical protein N9Z58_00185 [bacterium]|nr:hypothetical protein [bacterium]